MGGRFNLADSVSGIRSLLNSSPSPRVTAELDPDVVRYLERMRASQVEDGLLGEFPWTGPVQADPDPAGWRRVRNDVESDGLPDSYRANWPVHNILGDKVRLNPAARRRLEGQLGMGPPVLRDLDVPPVGPNDMSLDSPLFRDMYKADHAFDNLRRGRTANLRNSGGDLARIAGQNIRAADDAARAARAAEGGRDAAYLMGGALGLAALGTGLSQMATPGTAPGGTPAESVLTTGGAEDLVEESRPAPEVPAEPDEPVDYSMQAREMINQLNAMRRAAGGEVPEAPAMMTEINRLMALGNQTRRATAVAAPQDDAGRLFQQAQSLIDQVNQMYRQGASQHSPQVQQLMAQVRQLQAQGDAIRNRRA